MTDEEKIIERILNVIPPRSFELMTFLSLFRVRFSNKTETACVTYGDSPELLLNQEFIGCHCKTDEHLFMLVMHELYHVILGHTRLFPRSTEVRNLVFDAVINALLCSLFPRPEFTSFFTEYYPPDKMPYTLLRPKGRGTPPEAENALRLLYGGTHCLAVGTDQVALSLIERLITERGIADALHLELDLEHGAGQGVQIGDHGLRPLRGGAEFEDEVVAVGGRQDAGIAAVRGEGPARRGAVARGGSPEVAVDRQIDVVVRGGPEGGEQHRRHYHRDGRQFHLHKRPQVVAVASSDRRPPTATTIGRCPFSEYTAPVFEIQPLTPELCGGFSLRFTDGYGYVRMGTEDRSFVRR